METVLPVLTALSELAVTLAVVVCFLVYMYLKNGKNEKAFNKLSDTIEKNSQALDNNSETLAMLKEHILMMRAK